MVVIWLIDNLGITVNLFFYIHCKSHTAALPSIAGSGGFCRFRCASNTLSSINLSNVICGLATVEQLDQTAPGTRFKRATFDRLKKIYAEVLK